MNLQELEAFQKISEEKSFYKAADALHITQPAISTRIKKLEAALNADLFYRKGREVHLTQYGKMFEPYAQRIVSLIEEAKGTIHDFQSTEQSRIEIGTTSRLCTYFLPRFLEKFQNDFPQVEIIIQTDRSEDILSKLAHDVIHVGLTNTPIHATGYVQIPIMKDKISLVTAPHHPLYQTYLMNQSISLKDLEAYTIINFNHNSTYYSPIFELLKKNDVNPKQNISVDNIEAMKRMVAKKVGIAFLPQLAMERELNEHTLVEIPFEESQSLSRETYLIYKKKTYINPSITHFVSVIKNVLLEK